MLVKFPPIFVADTKIIYGYDFVAPLKYGAIFGGPVFYQFLLGENTFIREKLEVGGLCGGLGGFRNKSLTSTAKHKCFRRCVIVVNKTEIPKKHLGILVSPGSFFWKISDWFYNLVSFTKFRLKA